MRQQTIACAFDILRSNYATACLLRSSLQIGKRCRDEGEDPALAAFASTLAQQLSGLPRYGINAENMRRVLMRATPSILAAAFGQLDTRNASQRASEVFAVLRNAPPSDVLSTFCCAETYTAILSLVRSPLIHPALYHSNHLSLHQCNSFRTSATPPFLLD